MTPLAQKALETIRCHGLVHDSSSPAVLMVSGGSDSTSLAYIASELACAKELGPLHMLHVNHLLRGEDSDADADFAASLSQALSIPLATVCIDVAALALSEGGNVEAIARRERYAAAHEVLQDACRQAGVPISQGRILVAHTADDRVENFYMRSIVGTGPGGFRSMLYLNGQVIRPLLDVGRQELRDFIVSHAQQGCPVARDPQGALWREDATNQHTYRFRAYVRHEIVPLAKERNPKLLATLGRTMNLIADEDDMLDAMTDEIIGRHVTSLAPTAEGFVLSPMLAAQRKPLLRRVVVKVLSSLLDPDERIEAASVEAVLSAYEDGRPKGGYVANIQGNLAVSANRNGVRIEPMAAYRTRRKK